MRNFSKILLILTLVHSLCIDVYAQNSVVVSKKEFKLIVLNSESDTLCCYKCTRSF